MKFVIALIASTFFTLSVAAQSKGTVQLYGYQQPVSQGKAPDANEDTGLRTSAGAGKNYFLYVVSPTRIYPAEVWIEGIRMGVTFRSVSQTPVEYGDETNIGSPKKQLVPKTSQKVLQLVLTPAVESKVTGSQARAAAKANDVVLVYKQAGTFYYTTLATLTDLDGVAAQ